MTREFDIVRDRLPPYTCANETMPFKTLFITNRHTEAPERILDQKIFDRVSALNADACRAQLRKPLSPYEKKLVAQRLSYLQRKRR